MTVFVMDKRKDGNVVLITGHFFGPFWLLQQNQVRLYVLILSMKVLLTVVDDPAAKWIEMRVLGSSTLEDKLDIASTWLNNCLENHQGCLSEVKSTIQVPARVVDVGPSDGSQEPCLRDSNRDVREWVTLSHCWGSTQPLRTTLTTFPSHCQSLPVEKLPKLFQDAILITRRLEYRYLWIDSLCIIQDSREDWEREISRMGSIYKHCVFMISADLCRASRESIFADRVDLKYVQQGCCSSNTGLRGTIATYPLEVRQKFEDRSTLPLRARAWTLQEDILSPRTLKWTREQLVWNCRSTKRSEEAPMEARTDYTSHRAEPNFKILCSSEEALCTAQQDKSDLLSGFSFSDPLILWYQIVLEFCHRKITFKTDTFPAISGIAKEVQRHTGMEYKAGIWMQDFHNGLLWSTYGLGLNPSSYIGPSWSWAVMGNLTHVYPAAILKNFTPEDRMKPIAKIFSVDVVPSTSDNFGSIKSGKLQIDSLWKSACSFKPEMIQLPKAEQKLSIFSDSPEGYEVLPGTICCWFDCFQWKEKEWSNLAGDVCARAIVFVQIGTVDRSKKDVSHWTGRFLEEYGRRLNGSTWALILEPVVDTQDEYRRIGVARISDELTDEWDAHLVTVI